MWRHVTSRDPNPKKIQKMLPSTILWCGANMKLYAQSKHILWEFPFLPIYIGNNSKFPALLNKSAISPDLGMESSQNSPKVCLK